MSIENTIDLLKTILKSVNDSADIADKLGITELFDSFNRKPSKKSIYAENKNINDELVKNTLIDNNREVPNNNSNININDSYYYKQKNTSSGPQSTLYSIVQELTPAKMEQAVILSEIIGKPRSKTRRKRRF